jgi:CheY-like chemotaxis protein
LRLIVEKTMSYTVFVVDDDPDDLEITRRALAKIGCVTCMTACRGEDALALLRGCAKLPSLIFLDLKMPGMNGIDTLRHIRSDGRLKHIPVIIVRIRRSSRTGERPLPRARTPFCTRPSTWTSTGGTYKVNWNDG